MKVLTLLTTLLLFTLAPCAANAAVISGVFTPTGDADFDLTALGTSDWAIWDTSSDPASGVPTNEKSGGTLIGSMSAIGGGNLRGSTSTTRPPYDFTFTDGISPPVGSVDNVNSLFNTDLGTVDVGVGLDVTLPTTNTHTVTVWVSGFEGEGELTASLPGATSYVDSSTVFDGDNPKDAGYYTLSVTPDSANDVLNLSHILDVSDGGNAHVMISAVSVSEIASPVPEPSTLLLALLGVGGLLMQRRRRGCSGIVLSWRSRDRSKLTT